MLHLHLLILPVAMLLQVTILPPHGRAVFFSMRVKDAAVCQVTGDDIVASTPRSDHILFNCVPEYAA